MKRHALVIALQLLSYAADGYYTQRNMARAGRHSELNPAARPFVGTTGRLAASSAAGAGLTILAERKFEARHPRWAAALAAATVAGHAYGAVESRRGYGK
jgi:hypothetical protein